MIIYYTKASSFRSIKCDTHTHTHFDHSHSGYRAFSKSKLGWPHKSGSKIKQPQNLKFDGGIRNSMQIRWGKWGLLRNMKSEMGSAMATSNIYFIYCTFHNCWPPSKYECSVGWLGQPLEFAV